MFKIKKNILTIINQTDTEYINELKRNILNNFNVTLKSLKNQKILFISDNNFLSNELLLEILIKDNDVYYLINKKKVFFNNLTNRIIEPNKLKKIEFDYMITSCIAFDLNNNILLDEEIIKITKNISVNKIVAYAYGIQMFELNDFLNKDIKKGTIISNNFVVK